VAEIRILVGIGANLASARFGPPRDTVEAALAALARAGIAVTARSRWFESAPVPLSDQPWYVNGVALVASSLAPRALLDRLHEIEAAFGRVRGVPNAPRVLDLDLLAHGTSVLAEEGGLVLPHPRLAERAFVLLPLADVAPDWRHPATGLGLPEMLANLAPGQVVRPLA
jgi:2-amino-4-hydroxy-6-hydroxymethyldihydropteridine diphosphokinase